MASEMPVDILARGTNLYVAASIRGTDGNQDFLTLKYQDTGTLQWAVRYHARLAAVLGVASVVAFFLLRHRRADRQAILATGALAVCLGIQGITGTIQYHFLNLPSEVVWLHVIGASFAWIAMLWAVAASGRLARRQAPVPDDADAPAPSLVA